MPKRNRPNKSNEKEPDNKVRKLDGIDDLLSFLKSIDTIEPEPMVTDTCTCKGIYCDHDLYSKSIPMIPDTILITDPDYEANLDDLILLGECYHCELQKDFHGISLKLMADLREPLCELRDMIGMKSIKESFVRQIVYFATDVVRKEDEMINFIIAGPPGVGKSHVIGVIARIYVAMGFLKKGHVVDAKRTDLVGKYMGHTAKMTQDCIDRAMGGILLIDEAYSLGNQSEKDFYSKEAVDTLNRNLTERAGEFVCGLAGYPEELEKTIFAMNQGMKSRFGIVFIIDIYNHTQLTQIFFLKLDKEKGFHADRKLKFKHVEQFIKENIDSFQYFGRDVVSLLFHSKIANTSRSIFRPRSRGVINLVDVQRGLVDYLSNRKKKENTGIPESIQHIYS